ncbi:MAG: hypothetical protein IH616_17935 [Gemmatimonadales bacterium]|nr:hypothetical protein [Gemmatimonadales bacterium]
MSDQELRKHVEELRDVLSVAESFLSLDQIPPERVKDLGHAVDNLRTSVWVALRARHAGEQDELLARMRVRRAIDTCEEVLADIYAETLTAETPGFFVFHATLQELSQVCAQEQR